MSELFDEPADATPLEPDEREGLLQTWITYRRDLNEAEQTNVAAGTVWARRVRRRDLLTEKFLRQLHERLFGDVWAWAGEFRRTERNIGIEPVRIPVELRTVLDDARYWIDHETFPPDEIAVRLHHRLVAIHPFPTGNGRTTRLMGDLVVARLGREPFPWGRQLLTDVSETRTRYIASLRAADNHDIGPLLEFARS
ncbi:MAG: mobile mystery protein B [Alphaproteobacteria bacterium]|nr:mobile mystery protein B [Alphaproteobacteria bacterium]